MKTPYADERTLRQLAEHLGLNCQILNCERAPALLDSAQHPPSPGLAVRYTPKHGEVPSLNLWLPIQGASGIYVSLFEEDPGEYELCQLPEFEDTGAMEAWIKMTWAQIRMALS